MTLQDGVQICLHLLNKRGHIHVLSLRWRYQVALVPGIAFGNKSCLRLSYAATEENITDAVTKPLKWPHFCSVSEGLENAWGH